MEQATATKGSAGWGFLAGLELAAKPNYLGDSDVIEGLVRDLGDRMLKRRCHLDWETAVRPDTEECRQVARILLGYNEAYTPMPNWNEPGHIDVFVAKEFGIEGPTAEDTLTDTLVEYLAELWHVVYSLAEHNVPAENCTWQIEIPINAYRNVMLGIC
jgi:hypothetical protein